MPRVRPDIIIDEYGLDDDDDDDNPLECVNGAQLRRIAEEIRPRWLDLTSAQLLAMHTYRGRERPPQDKLDAWLSQDREIMNCQFEPADYIAHTHIPQRQLFDDVLVPTALHLSRGNLNKFHTALSTVLEAWWHLVTANRRGGSSCSTPYNMDRAFFDSRGGEATHRFERGHGQFAFFYEKYGPAIALAAAAYQGWQCDEHYDGGDYSWSTRQMDELLAPLGRHAKNQTLERCIRYIIEKHLIPRLSWFGENISRLLDASPGIAARFNLTTEQADEAAFEIFVASMEDGRERYFWCRDDLDSSAHTAFEKARRAAIICAHRTKAMYAEFWNGIAEGKRGGIYECVGEPVQLLEYTGTERHVLALPHTVRLAHLDVSVTQVGSFAVACTALARFADRQGKFDKRVAVLRVIEEYFLPRAVADGADFHRELESAFIEAVRAVLAVGELDSDFIRACEQFFMVLEEKKFLPSAKLGQLGSFFSQIRQFQKEQALLESDVPPDFRAAAARLAEIRALPRALTSEDTDTFITDMTGQCVDALERGLRARFGLMLLRFAIKPSAAAPSVFLAQTNPSTRCAVLAQALMDAAQGAGQLRLPQLNDDAIGVEDDIVRAAYDLRDAVFRALPGAEAKLLAARRRDAGMMPIGYKIHTQRQMPEDLLRELLRMFNLDSTSFSLIHAGHSLVGDVAVTAAEPMAIVKLLSLLGIVTGDAPQLQTAVAGAFDPRDPLVRVLGPALLLGTNTLDEFKPGAFTTTHSETGARILAHDGGERRDSLPFDVPDARGRTDKLACASVGDLRLHQLIGTLLVHARWGGPAAEVARALFIPRFESLLAAHEEELGIDSARHRALWIYTGVNRPGDTQTDHEEMVSVYVSAWIRSAVRRENTLWPEMQALLNEAHHATHRCLQRHVGENPAELDRLMRF